MHLVFLENEQQIRGKGNEGESQNPHQTLVIINIAKPMLCHSPQCYHCLLQDHSSPIIREYLFKFGLKLHN